MAKKQLEKDEQKKKGASKKASKKNQLTLLQAIERVVELSNDSQLSDEFMKKADPEISFLADSYGITKTQAVLFCVCMERGPRHVDFCDLAVHLDISRIKVLSYASEIDALVRRRLLVYRDVKEQDDFDVPSVVIRHLKHNEVYELPNDTELTCPELFALLEQWFTDLEQDVVDASELSDNICRLYEKNPQIQFVKQMKELYLPDEDQLMLTFFCSLLVNNGDDDVRFNQIQSVCENRRHFNAVKTLMQNGIYVLMERNLIEHRCEDGIASPNRFKLTNHAKRLLLEEMNVGTDDENIANVMKATELTKKDMFYSERNKKEVGELTSFCKEEQYRQIHERMQQRGFRSGFACLFYGAPGTGKTETVYQLARDTGRDIMVVDVPQIKSKWVGDSEKNIKAIFDRYRELVKRSEKAPILLFNEADAVIGIRKDGATNAVDKMENTVQNIILQEMETLDGIMIATTNLADNLDTAFERRFLYKINFEKPAASVRAKIWQTMIPELSADDCSQLAAAYEFSGGQIENVARKHAINVILHGDEQQSLKTLRDYCDAERLTSKKEARRIGF
ncbi:MAG: ATP-binding protein [Prevotella sp.]|nr:ATP-binding protein [Prevotella sp.]